MQLVVALAICSLFPSGYASIGDNSPLFTRCTEDCRQRFDCPTNPAAYAWTTKHCFECRHECLWRTVDAFLANGYEVPQFFGKWPFAAVHVSIGPFYLLVQEPASVVFSLLNLYGVLRMLRRIRREVPSTYRIKQVWIGYAYVGISTWIFSAFFHSCDFWLSEYLDYFAAASVIAYALFAALSFTVPYLQLTEAGQRIWLVLGVTILFAYTRYVHYLFSTPRFDYGFNMRWCIGCSISTAAIYVMWALKEALIGRARRSLGILLLTLVISLSAAAFEVLDFAPLLWTVDAHSLFHLMTVPTPWLLAEFACAEARHEEGYRGPSTYRKHI